MHCREFFLVYNGDIVVLYHKKYYIKGGSYMLTTIFTILAICFGIIAVLFLAATVVWIVFFKAIKGTSKNIKETVRMIKEPSRKVKERHIFYEENGVRKEVIEKL